MYEQNVNLFDLYEALKMYFQQEVRHDAADDEAAGEDKREVQHDAVNDEAGERGQEDAVDDDVTGEVRYDAVDDEAAGMTVPPPLPLPEQLDVTVVALWFHGISQNEFTNQWIWPVWTPSLEVPS